MATTAKYTALRIEALANHITLPPQLPGGKELNLAEIESDFIPLLLESISKLGNHGEHQALRLALQSAKLLNTGGRLRKASLIAAFRRLQLNDLLILHVVEQNCGIVVRRDLKDYTKHVVFEVMELSARAESVLESKNALLWSFPGNAVALNLAKFNETSFQDELAGFLEKASGECIKRFAAHTHKAGSMAYESRDTSDPALISQMLMALLEANGARVSPSLLSKRVRDEVSWDKSEIPWRRSPFWLLLRVSINRHLCTIHGDQKGSVVYKLIICLVISRVLDESLPRLSPEMVVHIKAKLCRRIAKLEIDKHESPIREGYANLFNVVGPVFSKSVDTAVKSLLELWSRHTQFIERPVRPLPHSQVEPRHFRLSLRNSAPYIEQVLKKPIKFSRTVTPAYNSLKVVDFSQSLATARPFVQYSQRYYSLLETEEHVERVLGFQEPSLSSDTCLAISRIIEGYIKESSGAYNDDNEQTSNMLLTIMDLWVAMDKSAVELFPLLKEYSPCFSPSMFDILQLTRFRDIERLHRIRQYLQRRIDACDSNINTIFDPPKQGCFAERFWEDQSESLRLGAIQTSIEDEAEHLRVEKEQEWLELTAEYDALTRKIAESSCLYLVDDFLATVHDDLRCTKCCLQGQLRMYKIKIHEHPLPSDMYMIKVVLFELTSPRGFSTYRDTTWQILVTFALTQPVSSKESRMLLGEYQTLRKFSALSNSRFTLASTTKPFVLTHYAEPRLPVRLSDVCLPNGLKFKYYDTSQQIWPDTLRNLSFSRLFKLSIPMNSPFSTLLEQGDFAIDAIGPSSYQVVASQTRCPSGLNPHEFMAFQGLFPGRRRRWHQILVELGSTSLNFGTEAASELMGILALQAGPHLPDNSHGTVHIAFQDSSFCKQLIAQIDERLGNITSNYRESNLMETLITFSIRIGFMASPASQEAFGLLEKSRQITLNWIITLRSEMQYTRTASASARASYYALWSALLCKRSFTLYLDKEIELTNSELNIFFQASIFLQDNMPSDLHKLSEPLRKALLRDLKVTYRLRGILRRSLVANPRSLIDAISNVWSNGANDTSKFNLRPKFLDGVNYGWIELIVKATDMTDEQTAHFHLTEGHLLVMGKPIGKLPAKYRSLPVLQTLFGHQALLIVPSAVPGMTYMLAIAPQRHEIHLGFRNGELIVRALLPEQNEGRWTTKVLELIPSFVFGTEGSNLDLPNPLVFRCVHWIDINTGVIDIRSEPIWKIKQSNWQLNFHTRIATRRGSTLVDPHSLLARRISRIFYLFEYQHELVIYKPQSWRLTVELRRLELTFFVNQRGLLESSQLHAEIILDQDIGTWHGLDSKIILREVHARNGSYAYSSTGIQKIVIVPMGKVFYKRQGPHVSVSIQNNRRYAKYLVNEVLGRLECPPEPRLLYLKALCHAYTSFVLPDQLTGRTGTEEAVHCLQSGYSQPWMPLDSVQHQFLVDIAKLTPRRIFYPPDIMYMQQTLWDEGLTITIQFDGFRAIVEDIKAKSEKLSLFASRANEIPILKETGNQHLTTRSLARRLKFHRHGIVAPVLQPDLTYEARDFKQDDEAWQNVFETANLFQGSVARIKTPIDLLTILKGWPKIGGYYGKFEKESISELLHTDLALNWGSLVNTCIDTPEEGSNRLIFLFCTIAFQENIDMEVVRSMAAFRFVEDVKKLPRPEWQTYTDIKQGASPRFESLLLMLKSCFVASEIDEQASGLTLSHKSRHRIETEHLKRELDQEEQAKTLAKYLLAQWPCAMFSLELSKLSPLIDLERTKDIVQPEWLRLFQNYELSEYIVEIQKCFDHNRSDSPFGNPRLRRPVQLPPSRICRGEMPSLHGLVASKQGTVSSVSNSICVREKSVVTSQLVSNEIDAESIRICDLSSSTQAISLSNESHQLQIIIDQIMESTSKVRKQYASDLMNSLASLRVRGKTHCATPRRLDLQTIQIQLKDARTVVSAQFSNVKLALELDDCLAPWLVRGDLWPAITPVTLLETLRSSGNLKFGLRMRQCLIEYALSITRLQKLLRIESHLRKNEFQKAYDEDQNAGHTNWNPNEHVDWLLLEIDCNILIRPTQVSVAQATILPSSGSNSVLQMNMGEGKTSVIMPMAACLLADGINLHRVIVPKALLFQTAQLLQARLGGLLGRSVTHIPFSRKTSTKAEVIQSFYDLHRDARQACGVIIALPEHLLSFKLSGLQRLSDDRITEARYMIKVQGWLHKWSRDVTDECDNIYAIRTQLIYPSGPQNVLDGHPRRWRIVEVILSQVEGHLWNLQKAFPESIEVVKRTEGSFPIPFFLRKDVEDALITRLIDDVCCGKTPLLPTDCTKLEILAIKEFISQARVPTQVADTIEQLHLDKPSVKESIYLLRGLFVHRILIMTLKKRWNVQYGLHPGRDPIAVPFYAKGTPSEQAEWGHPDVMITLTCLAFYYSGLRPQQVRQTLEHILKSDDPSHAYHQFSEKTRLPGSLKQWNAINVDDDLQLQEIWNCVRYEKTVIDYFLNNFVFPCHAKQFQLKLQASGWDLPLFNQPPGTGVSPSRTSLTTGFSGTNDWKRMLPLTIMQNDLTDLSHTNAQVLMYLLEARNRSCILLADGYGHHITEEAFLGRLHFEGIHVLIDAGAQVLELSNKSLCQAWLLISHESPAAVFFNEESVPCVLYRNGYVMPLFASPYAEDLGDCLVYLDEAHTRGTDLKLPPNARGALTLGLGQTKDHTVQAAMRLRQLGTTQSVVFFAPPKVHQSILDSRKQKSSRFIDSYDVILWLLEQTCNGIELLQPLYYSQGVDFCRRVQAAADHNQQVDNLVHNEAYLRALRTLEQQSLEQLYGVRHTLKSAWTVDKYSPHIESFMKQLEAIRKGFQDTGNAVHASALQEVEQEREVAYEVEAVREVQKPIHYNPFLFPGLSQDIESFARTGHLPVGTHACVGAFNYIAKSEAGRKYGINAVATSGKLFVSLQFTMTINTRGRLHDQFQRPVNWILWSEVTEIALIIIPEEAELLLGFIENTSPSPTHLITYAAPVTRRMSLFNSLNYYSVPQLPINWTPPMWLRVELGIFSGRLYFEFSEYTAILEFLGVEEQSGPIPEKDQDDHDSEVANGEDSSSDVSNQLEDLNEILDPAVDLPHFSRKPLPFLQQWISIRRKGQDFSQTPMGFICAGKSLNSTHSFFTKIEHQSQALPETKHSKVQDASDDREEDVIDDFCEDDMFADTHKHMKLGDHTEENFNDEDLDEERDDLHAEGSGSASD